MAANHASELLKLSALVAFALIALGWLLGCGNAQPGPLDMPATTARNEGSTRPPAVRPTTTAPVTTLAPGELSSAESAWVTEVLDVDTVQTVRRGKSETVRLLGVMPPPPGSAMREQGRRKLMDLVEGESVLVDFDDQERDEQGRLVAYLFREGKMVNAELVRLGYARVRLFVRLRLGDHLYSAAREAGENRQGIWATFNPDVSRLPFAPTPHYPEGTSLDLNDEWLEIKGTATTNLSGYAVENYRGEAYVFPDLPLAPGQTVRLHSGAGTSSATDLYWGTSALMWNVSQPDGGFGGAIGVFDPQGRLLYELFWVAYQ